jgi:hypothetical protein
VTLVEALLVAVGAVAAIAAVGAWRAARSSSQASAAMTAIERRRWHAPPGPTVLHLTRILVALAEQHAIRAEQATAGDADPADVELFACQDTYDKATAGGALELLMVAYWRAQPLTAGVEALRAELTGAHAQQHPEAEDADPLAEPSG